MLNVIEKLIRDGYYLTIEEERYGKGIYIAFDNTYICHYNPLEEMINRATSAGDIKAVDYQETLELIEKKFPDYPFTRANTLEEGFKEIAKKAEKWNRYDSSEQIRITEEIADLEKQKEKEWREGS